MLKNVLYVPYLLTNLLYVYQMTHTGSPKWVIFDPNSVEISKISIGNLIMKGFSNHAFKAYEFSHFLPHSYQSALLTHANEINRIWHERFVRLNFKYLQQLHNEEMVEDFPLIKSSNGFYNCFFVGKNLERTYEVRKVRWTPSSFELVHSDVSKPMCTTSMNGSI